MTPFIFRRQFIQIGPLLRKYTRSSTKNEYNNIAKHCPVFIFQNVTVMVTVMNVNMTNKPNKRNSPSISMGSTMGEGCVRIVSTTPMGSTVKSANHSSTDPRGERLQTETHANVSVIFCADRFFNVHDFKVF